MNWIQSHKALLGGIAAALVAVAPVIPPPYNAIPIGIATVIGGIIGGPVAIKVGQYAFRKSR